MTVTIEPQLELDLDIETGNGEGLPEGWVETPIGDLIFLNPKNDVGDAQESGFISMSNLGKSFLDVPKFETKLWGDVKKGYTHFASGDVLLAKITPCFENGKSGIPRNLPNGIGAGSTEYFVCRPEPELLEGRLLLAFFQTESFVKVGAVEMTGSVGHKRVPKEYVTETVIPLPPLPEQLRIADKLDTLLSRVDAGRERLERVPKLIKRFRQSVLSAAVTGELTREWRESMYSYEALTQDVILEERKRVWESQTRKRSNVGKYKSPLPSEMEDIPDLPESWEWASVDQITEFVTDGEHATPPRAETGVLLLSARNVVNGGLRLDKVDFVSEETFLALSQRILPIAGDVLLSCSGTVGRSCVVPDGIRFSLVRSVAIMRPLLNMGQWLSFVLRSPLLQELIQDRQTQTAQANLFQGKIKVLPVPLPPQREQAEIVRRVEALFAFADRLEARYASALQSFNRLTPALLAKAFRGELVPQDPNDEPASVLLERIREQRAAATSKAKGKTPTKAKVAVDGGESGAEPKQRGRPPGARAAAAPTPTASSYDEAVRKLQELGQARAEGTRQVSLFED